MRITPMHQRYLVIFSTFLIFITLYVSLPSNLPPTFHALSHNPSPTLDSLVATFPYTPPQTPLHSIYHKFSKCPQATDLSALRIVLQSKPSNSHPFVVCLSRPVSTSYLTLIQKLSKRLGPPFVTTTDAMLISQLAHRNITPILPESPDDSLSAMARASSLLVRGSMACAIGARVAKGIVYYTQDYLSFVSKIGYEWLPDNGARLDGFDRGHRAVLAGLGTVHESCCTFNNGLCTPVRKRCTAVVMGDLRTGVGCRVSKVCKKGRCPHWKTIVKRGVPDVLIMDISGDEFRVLKEIAATEKLPKQIVMRMRVWADRDLGEGWANGMGGWIVSRNFVAGIVASLRKRGYRLVHRVDDDVCQWCAFVTFLKY